MTDSIKLKKLVDWAEIDARRKLQDVKRKAKRMDTRAALLADLRALGITQIEGRYDGYGDSGNAECVGFSPSTVEIDTALIFKIANFIWDMAYNQSPGFENNEGGEGDLRWDIEADKIAIDHAAFYTERDEYSWEDL